jgi:methionyl-tRNA formyltransferase
MNSDATQAAIAALEPELLVVSGAPILRPNIYHLAPLGTVNLHFGISPIYRGMHTLETPWKRQDYAHIGATAHFINDGIDAGPVLFRVFPSMQPTDDLPAVEARVVRDIASALSDFLAWLKEHRTAMPATGREFPETGRLVRFHDRRIRDDVRSRVQRLAGARAPLLASRVETFYC